MQKQSELTSSRPLCPAPKSRVWGIRTTARHQRGQTIVIALLVLLLLAFVGGLFATIVTRNLANAGRSNRVQSADYYAEAGIRFANDQLTASLDGADWRPPLQNQLDAPYQPKDPLALARYTAAVTSQSLAAVSANDPDHDYLVQGFSRYNIGGGRYLLRVTYDPAGINNQDNASATANTAYADPRARYLKIEAVGREGTVDSNDPTTYQNVPKTQLNATLVQYKAIGITDYARFETNPENRSDIMALGVSSQYNTTAAGIVTPGVFDFNGNTTTPNPYPIVTTYGASDAYLASGANGLIPNPAAGSNTTNGIPGGGSIHANGSVRFFGENNIYLNNAEAPTPKTGNTNTAITGLFGDTVEVAGNLLLDNYNPATALTTGQDASVQAFVNADTAANANYVYPSNDQTPSTNVSRFSTFGGAIRDSSGGNDASGDPRSVSRLEPPTLDTVNPVTNLPRYADLTKNSTPRATESTATAGTPTDYAATAAAYGYGQSIYIDNTTDVQRESSSIVGGYTLVDEWLHRAGADGQGGSKSGWSANFYRPPGVDIVLGRQQVELNNNTATSFYGVRMTRSDVDGAGSLIGWKDPTTGNPIVGVTPDGNTQSTMTVSYKSLNASNDLTSNKVNAANPSNDVVIYAAGNVRVHGVVSADAGNNSDPTTYAGTYAAADDDHLPRHVTIITDGTAYIDGSLLRGNPESSITVLAHDYVCVNTTQFLAGTISDQTPAGTSSPGAFVGDPNLRALDFSASDEVLLQEFRITALPNSGDEHLYISGGPSGPGATAFDVDLLNANTGYSLAGTNQTAFTFPYPATSKQYTPNTTLSPGLPYFASIDSTGFTQPNFFTTQTGLLRTTFDLGTGVGSLLPSQTVQLALRRDEGSDGTPSTQDFLLERAAILPMDIKIEAVLFAQTRSFFVIPGDWFNSSTDDNVQAYANNAKRPGIDVAFADQNRFPFYGQPIDMKITIDGAISEARPADITAQSAWMAKWGWIPQYHGGLTGTSNGEATGRPAFNGTANPLGIGLQIIYNPLAGFPYYQDPKGAANTGHYLRTDIYGRPLPYAPKLPVCEGLLYAGQNTGESVLQ